ncbi:hypothetical protein GALMADRAFT_225543 [Galerina marginata CBS 339.88]|uniref:F-box domain-containing protein n=1 Tax=Galerina marginata (strain CBS 339.88) TaxID=685588 RepID=A0A067TC00_GALM3|nr:hypothetical protein GALMADRAFT_225543 [Galerina marginata CBS 339.88]
MSSTSNVTLDVDVVETIFDALAEDYTDFTSLRACSLACRAFLPLCRKHIYASINLNHSFPGYHSPTTLMLERLLLTTPELAGYIRKLDYCITAQDFGNPMAPDVLRQITRLQSLVIWHHVRSEMQWNNNPLRPALLHLLHLPTLIHLTLSTVENFVVSDLIPCVNLKNLEVYDITTGDAPESFSPVPPQKPVRLKNLKVGDVDISELGKFYITRRPDGKLVMDFSDLVKISIQLNRFDLKVPRGLYHYHYLFKHCGPELSSTYISVFHSVPLTGLFKLLEPCMQTLRHLCVRIRLSDNDIDDPLSDLLTEFEEVKQINMIESITVFVDTPESFKGGDVGGRFDQVLTSSSWSSLKRVSLTFNDSAFGLSQSDGPKALLLARTMFPRLLSRKTPKFDFMWSKPVGIRWLGR